jgi:hypothetical protein
VEGTPLEDACFASSAPNNWLVFIDDRLIEYRRTGKCWRFILLVETLNLCKEVFHQCADLDPSRHSDDFRKKIRSPSSSGQKCQRPQMPLYAMRLPTILIQGIHIGLPRKK